MTTKTWDELLEEANPEMAVKYELMRAEYYRQRNMQSQESEALRNADHWRQQL